MGHQLERLTHCLNCAEPTAGNYCSNCGQENENQTASLKAVAEDFLDDIIHFDSRLVRTAIPLVFKPGFLTNEYNQGRRVSYLSPYRMYLFVSAVFFLLLAYNGVDLSNTHSVTITKGSSKSGISVTTDQKTKASVLSALNQAGIGVNPDGTIKGHPDIKISEKSESLNEIAKQAFSSTTSQKSDYGGDLSDNDNDDSNDGSSKLVSSAEVFGHKIDLTHLPKTVDIYNADQAALSPVKRDPVWVQNLCRNIITFKSDPSQLQDRLLDLIPRMTFFLVPLYAASLYPMYLRRKKYYVEHLIYSLHTHSFVFVMFTIILLLDLPAVKRWPPLHHTADVAIFLVLAAIPVYLFMAMKKVYGQSIGKTSIKFVIAWSNYWVLLTLAFLATFAYAFIMR